MSDFALTLIILTSVLAGVVIGVVVAGKWYGDDGY